MSENTESVTVTKGDVITHDSHSTSNDDNIELSKPDKIEELVVEDLTEFNYFGVKFPGYFRNPRFVQTNDLSFTIAIDTDNMSMELKANWNTKYLPELAELTKKILQKLTKEKIPKL